ncbi:MAG: ATP-binding protein [Syntrophorhabdales bacterium]|jgi:DNA transposition AAA+ family ATPase
MIVPSKIKPIQNVALCTAAMQEAMNRRPEQDGIVVLSGPTGFGKTYAACYVANTFHSIYVECTSTFTKKVFFAEVAEAVGISSKGTSRSLEKEVTETLVALNQPLIVDEVDYLVRNGLIDVIRDIHRSTGVACLLIGEEELPQKLLKWTRVTGRVLRWVPAQPVSLDDARALAPFYSPKVDIADDLLGAMVKAARGSVRQVSANLVRIEAAALKKSVRKLDLAAWLELGLPSLIQDPPSVRKFS